MSSVATALVEKGLEGFKFEKLLFSCPKGSKTVMLGKFNQGDSSSPAIVELVYQPPYPSTDLVNRLNNFQFELRMHSGAEYAYFESNLDVFKYSAEVIFPASNKQIAKKTPALVRTFFETAEIYKSVTEPYFVEKLAATTWIKNILFGEAEKERVLLRRKDPQNGFVLVINPNWNSHPDPSKYDITQLFVQAPDLEKDFIKELNYLVIVERENMKSLRDLTAEHIPLLEEIEKLSLEKIEQVYGLNRKYIRTFVHYFPQFYHLHCKRFSTSTEINHLKIPFFLVHFRHISIPSTASDVMLNDIIQNLKLSSVYYKNVTRQVYIPENDPLCILLEKHVANSSS
jgi:m7GpppX diphosphatase